MVILKKPTQTLCSNVKQILKITSRGLQIDTMQIFNMCILILSWPWDLFESRFFIILAISSVVKTILGNDASVQYKILSRTALLLFITEHCCAK